MRQRRTDRRGSAPTIVFVSSARLRPGPAGRCLRWASVAALWWPRRSPGPVGPLSALGAPTRVALSRLPPFGRSAETFFGMRPGRCGRLRAAAPLRGAGPLPSRCGPPALGRALAPSAALRRRPVAARAPGRQGFPAFGRASRPGPRWSGPLCGARSALAGVGPPGLGPPPRPASALVGPRLAACGPRPCASPAARRGAWRAAARLRPLRLLWGGVGLVFRACGRGMRLPAFSPWGAAAAASAALSGDQTVRR